MRDDGGMGLFCGEHRCHAGACERERVGGQFCEEHTCRVGGCNAGFADEAGRFCAEHECARAECRLDRYRLFGNGSTFCHVHKCQDRECVREAMNETGWCERHQPCSVEGCRRQRVVEGEMVTAHCELRELRLYPLTALMGNYWLTRPWQIPPRLARGTTRNVPPAPWKADASATTIPVGCVIAWRNGTTRSRGRRPARSTGALPTDAASSANIPASTPTARRSLGSIPSACATDARPGAPGACHRPWTAVGSASGTLARCRTVRRRRALTAGSCVPTTRLRVRSACETPRGTRGGSWRVLIRFTTPVTGSMGLSRGSCWAVGRHTVSGCPLSVQGEGCPARAISTGRGRRAITTTFPSHSIAGRCGWPGGV